MLGVRVRKLSVSLGVSLTNFIEKVNKDVAKKSTKIPKHVAFIMDGNRRYSTMMNISRKQAYRMGAQNLVDLIPISYEYAFEEISFYTFSLDNFGRCLAEQNEIFEALKDVLQEKVVDKISVYKELGIYIRFVGKVSLLPLAIQELGRNLEKQTRPSDEKKIKLVVNINIAYSGLLEICKVGESILKRLQRNSIDEIDLNSFEETMYLKKTTRPVDLMIRTSGEFRKSDFLLWESSDSKFFSIDKMWPEFELKNDLAKAVIYYQQE